MQDKDKKRPSFYIKKCHSIVKQIKKIHDELHLFYKEIEKLDTELFSMLGDIGTNINKQMNNINEFNEILYQKYHQRPGGIKKITEENESEIIKLHLIKHPITRIAKKFNIHPSTIKRFLKNMDLK